MDKLITAQRIRELRLESEKTGVNVSTILGIDQSYYSKIEKGRHTPTLENLIKIAELYNVSLDYITGRTSNREVNR